MIRFLFALAAVLCAAAAYAVEPPVIRDVEPPSIVGQCECSTGAPCICGESCSCTVPVIATLPYDADHTCNKCGTYANVVEREFANGTHSHRCGNCGNEWYHADPGVQYTVAPASNPFATGDCPNGNCARGSAPRIVGTAGVVRSVYGLSDRPRLLSGDRPRVFDGTGWHPGKVLGAVFGRLRGCR